MKIKTLPLINTAKSFGKINGKPKLSADLKKAIPIVFLEMAFFRVNYYSDIIL